MKKASSVALLTLVAIAAFSSPAVHAAKEKFVRNKPHVNIGTITVNPNEVLTLLVRLNQPAGRENVSPECVFRGHLEIRYLFIDGHSSESTSGDTMGKLELRSGKPRVELRDPSEVFIWTLPIGGPRETVQLELRADRRKDACDLDTTLEVHNPATGASRSRHTPFVNTYRPQFYIRTTD